MIKNKKGGFEMSITTLVIIVIAVVMLILGLVLVRQIFRTATESASVIDVKVKEKLQTLFGEEERDLVMYGKSFNVKPGTSGFSIPFAAKTFRYSGAKICSPQNMSYNVLLGDGDCIGIGTWFLKPSNLNQWSNFDDFEADTAYGDIVINVPRGQSQCTNIIKVQLKCKDQDRAHSSSSFTLNIIRGGLFG